MRRLLLQPTRPRALAAIPGRALRQWEPDASEQLVLDATGGLIVGRHGRMKLGRLVLTNRRLLLLAATGIREQVLLEKIQDLGIERLYYLLRNRDTVVLTCHQAQDGAPGFRRIVVCVDQAERWRNKIFELTKLELTAADVELVAAELSGPSAVVLRYVWQHEHARIDELMQACDAACHMDVLLRIRKEINPTAERLTGYPVLVFKVSGRQGTGSSEVPLSWWISGKASGRRDDGALLVDVFDEGDCLEVVVDGLGIGPEDIRLNLAGDKLTLLISAGRLYRHEIALPCRVVLENAHTRLHNGILVATLDKAAAGQRGHGHREQEPAAPAFAP